MNKKRLLKLADLLEADANNPEGAKFDIRKWGNGKGEPTVSCGTKVCAMGLAAVSGVFKKQGLTCKVERYRDLKDGFVINIGFKGENDWYTDGFIAAQRLFEITSTESDFLFSDSSYSGRTTGRRGELYVAKRIRDFVAGKVAPAIAW